MDTPAPGPQLTVHEALERWPRLVAVFVRHGMACPGCPMARFENLAEAAVAYRLPIAPFLLDLRLQAGARWPPQGGARRAVLPHLPPARRPQKEHCMTVKTHLDVRPIPAPQKHPAIFGAFESLEAGEAFELINDHDPKPLYYEFAAERAGQFTWEYVERGPQIWRVTIGKPLA